MPVRSNTAEGGTHGVTVTQGSGGNSGGGSGDYWDVISAPANGTFTFDNTNPAAGLLGYKIVRPTDTHFAAECRWEFADETEFYGRFYVYLVSSTWPTGGMRFTMPQSSVGGRRAELLIESTGKLRILNSTAGTAATAAAAFSLNTLYRIEYHFLADLGTPANGRMETSYYLGHSTTAIENLAVATNINTGGAAGRLAMGGSGAAVTDGYTWYFDEVKLGTSGWLGPGVSPMIVPARPYPPTTFGPF